MSIRREHDARRVAKSVRSHEATMAAYKRQINTKFPTPESSVKKKFDEFAVDKYGAFIVPLSANWGLD